MSYVTHRAIHQYRMTHSYVTWHQRDMGHVGRFRATLLLRTTRMRPQRLGGVSGVVALQTNKQENQMVL